MEYQSTLRCAHREAAAGLTGIPWQIFCSQADQAVWFHCSFERIHAFADGNGRVGRTLLNYILMMNDVPPVVIFDEDKETYFMALEVFDHSDKIDGFVQFLKEQAVKTWVRKTPKGKEFVAM